MRRFQLLCVNSTFYASYFRFMRRLAIVMRHFENSGTPLSYQ